MFPFAITSGSHVGVHADSCHVFPLDLKWQKCTLGRRNQYSWIPAGAETLSWHTRFKIWLFYATQTLPWHLHVCFRSSCTGEWRNGVTLEPLHCQPLPPKHIIFVAILLYIIPRIPLQRHYIRRDITSRAILGQHVSPQCDCVIFLAMRKTITRHVIGSVPVHYVICWGPCLASWLYVGYPWLLPLCAWIRPVCEIRFRLYIIETSTIWEILNIGLSDTFMINQNQWRACSCSAIHIRISGVQKCIKICEGKQVLPLVFISVRS
jgi:hypothetical protein